MVKIFISYRREDTVDIAGRIDDRLRQEFGREAVFFDDTISYGEDFPKRLDEAASGCKVLLAIIGPKWLDVRHTEGPNAGQRRLDDPRDFVRLEIEAALKRGNAARVVPVLTGWATMPSPEALPESIRDLASLHAAAIHSGSDFHRKVDELIQGIEPYAGKPTRQAEPDRPEAKVVPKGLRAFDAGDADFYLQLLPPPYDRDGLPETVRFWKIRIEEREPDTAFSVGLLHGPSGCGKSSLVQAGLRPRLGEHVVPIYDAATPEGTAPRLARKVHAKCPGLDPDADLTASLAALTEGRGLPPGGKLVLLLDQFEQWLHTTPHPEETALFQALRQCDGQHVQAVIMVRDEFAGVAIRLIEALGVHLATGYNIASVDLFGQSHARNVLVHFGQAYEQLSANDYGKLPPNQQQFLDQAVAGLSHQRKVVPVHLALFADMVRDREWTGTTLQGSGAAEQVGIEFLDERILGPRSRPKLRQHPQAVLRILGAMLPPPGAEIKGVQQSHQQLLAQAELTDRRVEFDAIVEELSSELRLITPAAADGQEDAASGEKYYQLTHDYLVHSLRTWIERELGRTRRGRAELHLKKRVAQWNRAPVARSLPGTAGVRGDPGGRAWWETDGRRADHDACGHAALRHDRFAHRAGRVAARFRDLVWQWLDPEPPAG